VTAREAAVEAALRRAGLVPIRVGIGREDDEVASRDIIEQAFQLGVKPVA
jgi:hypothetical protein